MALLPGPLPVQPQTRSLPILSRLRMVPTPSPRVHDACEKDTAASESCVKLYLAGGFAHYSDLVAPWQLRVQTSTLNGGVISRDVAWAGGYSLGRRLPWLQAGWMGLARL